MTVVIALPGAPQIRREDGSRPAEHCGDDEARKDLPSWEGRCAVFLRLCLRNATRGGSRKRLPHLDARGLLRREVEEPEDEEATEVGERHWEPRRDLAALPVVDAILFIQDHEYAA